MGALNMLNFQHVGRPPLVAAVVSDPGSEVPVSLSTSMLLDDSEHLNPRVLIVAVISPNALGPPSRQNLDHFPKRDIYNGCSCTPQSDAQEDPMPHQSFDAFMTLGPGSPLPNDYNIRRSYLGKLMAEDQPTEAQVEDIQMLRARELPWLQDLFNAVKAKHLMATLPQSCKRQARYTCMISTYVPVLSPRLRLSDIQETRKTPTGCGCFDHGQGKMRSAEGQQ
jgi:hypothetical protein